MEFEKNLITKKGLELQAKVQAGLCSFIFNKTAVGDGSYTVEEKEELADAKHLKAPKKDFLFTQRPRIIDKKQVLLKSMITNREVTEGFYIREYGIFAEDPDEGEILYALGIVAEEKADWLPPGNGAAECTIKINSYVSVANAEYVVITQNGYDYVTFDTLSDHVNNNNNPHKVTKGQVGLANVPDVATNDQTPTYAEAQELTALESGEKLSAAFGKLKKAVNDVKTHLKDNVRHLTAAERSSWNAKAEKTAATVSLNGLMSAADKKKLDGVAAGANNYVHPATAGYKHIPAGGSSGQILKWSTAGTAAWAAETNTWRGIQNNLTSTSTTDSLAAAQGKALNDKITQLNTDLAHFMPGQMPELHWDSLKSNGFYYYSSTSKYNQFNGACILCVMGYNTSEITRTIQMAFSGSVIYSRANFGTVWGPWVKFTGISV